MCVATVPLLAEKVTFQRAVQLAVARSVGMGVAQADEAKAKQAYMEQRDAYVPMLMFGSGLGASWGYPLSIEGSAPSIFNITAQSTIFNMSQREFVRAAHTAWTGAGYMTAEQKKQTVLDTALTYAQLLAATQKLKSAQDELQLAQNTEALTRDRVQEGIDSKLELTRSSLNSARARMRVATAQSQVDILLQHLSQLTAVPVNALEIDPESMPAIPEADLSGDVVERAVQNSHEVKAADAQTLSREQQAKAEHRALYPSFDMSVNYARLSTINNYDQFFRPGSFQPNNATIGVGIRFPFINFAQRARVDAARAEAVKAKRLAEGTRNKVSAETLQLQGSIAQLRAARDVAQLDYELAQGNVDIVEAKVQAGNASLRDVDNTKIEVAEKYAALLDAQIELDKARLQLLNASGELQQWAQHQ
jgi:outer membrane protein TolC